MPFCLYFFSKNIQIICARTDLYAFEPFLTVKKHIKSARIKTFICRNPNLNKSVITEQRVAIERYYKAIIIITTRCAYCIGFRLRNPCALAALILRDMRIAPLRSRNPTSIRNPHYRATSSCLFGLLMQSFAHASMTNDCIVTLYHAKKSLIEPILYQGRILKLYPRCHLEFMCYHATQRDTNISPANYACLTSQNTG